MKETLAVIGGYLLGSLPFGYWLPRIFRGEDIRAGGSGNVGASNVFRVYGRRLGIAVALLDVAKGFTAALLGLWAGGALVGVLAGAAAMIGHARPIFLRFQKGGKMVATAGGATFALAPLTALLCIGVWLVIFTLTRYASLASIATALALAVFVVLFRLPVARRRVRNRRCSRRDPRAPSEHPPASRWHRAPLRASPPAPGLANARRQRALRPRSGRVQGFAGRNSAQCGFRSRTANWRARRRAWSAARQAPRSRALRGAHRPFRTAPRRHHGCGSSRS